MTVGRRRTSPGVAADKVRPRRTSQGAGARDPRGGRASIGNSRAPALVPSRPKHGPLPEPGAEEPGRPEAPRVRGGRLHHASAAGSDEDDGRPLAPRAPRVLGAARRGHRRRCQDLGGGVDADCRRTSSDRVTSRGRPDEPRTWDRARDASRPAAPTHPLCRSAGDAAAVSLSGTEREPQWPRADRLIHSRWRIRRSPQRLYDLPRDANKPHRGVLPHRHRQGRDFHVPLSPRVVRTHPRCATRPQPVH